MKTTGEPVGTAGRKHRRDDPDCGSSVAHRRYVRRGTYRPPVESLGERTYIISDEEELKREIEELEDEDEADIYN